MRLAFSIVALLLSLPMRGQQASVERTFGATSFPNPCTNQCIVRFHNLDKIRTEVTRAAIIDMSGGTMRNFLSDVKKAGRVETLDISVSTSNFPPGVYFLVTSQNGLTDTWKILKQ